LILINLVQKEIKKMSLSDKETNLRGFKYYHVRDSIKELKEKIPNEINIIDEVFGIIE